MPQACSDRTLILQGSTGLRRSVVRPGAGGPASLKSIIIFFSTLLAALLNFLRD